MFEGIKSLEIGRLRFVETTDSASATIDLSYLNPLTGKGRGDVGMDEKGPYLSKWWISIRGDPPTPDDGDIPYLGSHEAFHAVKCSGEVWYDEKYVRYTSFMNSSARWAYNMPIGPSDIEKEFTLIFFNMERNPALLCYFK